MNRERRKQLRRNRYHQNKLDGLCIRCKSIVEEDGLARCGKCRKYDADFQLRKKYARC